MRDLHRQFGLLADVDRFVNGFRHLQAFVAHVRGIDAAILRGYAREEDHLIGIGIHAGQVDQSRGQPHGPVPHGLGHDAHHFLQVLFGCGFISQAHAQPAHGIVPGQRGDVDRCLRAVYPTEKICDIVRGVPAVARHY